jgi:hypothetical protein
MSVERLEFLVEEPSMEAVLREMLPAWLGKIEFEVFPYQGKEDLLSNLPARLKGYSRFLPETWRLVVLVDRDNCDCIVLKKKLEDIAASAGLTTRSTSENGTYKVANRIVIEELESWYFGDWQAVRQAYPKIDIKWTGKAGYRDPDAIAGGTSEAFERIARSAGYFKGGLRKVEAAREIGSRLKPESNKSRSFQALRIVIDELIAEI